MPDWIGPVLMVRRALSDGGSCVGSDLANGDGACVGTERAGGDDVCSARPAACGRARRATFPVCATWLGMERQTGVRHETRRGSRRPGTCNDWTKTASRELPPAGHQGDPVAVIGMETPRSACSDPLLRRGSVSRSKAPERGWGAWLLSGQKRGLGQESGPGQKSGPGEKSGTGRAPDALVCRDLDWRSVL